MANGVENALDALWVGWIIYWVVAEPLLAHVRSRTKAVVRIGQGNVESFILMIAAFGLLQVRFTGSLAFLGVGLVPITLAPEILGLVLAVGGLAFSVWARVYLGSNWSPMAMLKEGQALVTTGPYAIVRNPIYLGITIAMVGTGLVFGGYRILVSFACVVLFSWVRIRGEERLLSVQFGEAFAKYKREVRAFIPGLI
jgi:protein-S-isoprenylcysteine O-methyltransferase Ste14